MGKNQDYESTDEQASSSYQTIGCSLKLSSETTEHDYVSEKKFMGFAFPEYRDECSAIIEKKLSEFYDQEDLSNLNCKPIESLYNKSRELYDAWYSDDLINFLMEQIRSRLREHYSLHQRETGITLNNLILIKSKEDCLKLLEELKTISQQTFKQERWVLLSPLRIDEHFYALMIYIEKNISSDKTVVSIVLYDPYGTVNSYERKIETMMEILKPELKQLLHGDILFQHSISLVDLQGYDYDNSNCGALTVYIIEKYVEHALRDHDFKEYKIDYRFDCLPYPALNRRIHDAFVLRLKAYHLLLAEGNYTLGFQSAAQNEHIDENREKNAKNFAKVLYEIIIATSTETYSGFVEKKHFQFIYSLNSSNTFQLLNSISRRIIRDNVDCIINPQIFSAFLTSCFENVLKPIMPISREKRLELEEFLRQANLRLRDNFSQMFSPYSENKQLECPDPIKYITDLAFQVSSFDEFKEELQKKDLIGIFKKRATEILRRLLNKYISMISNMESLTIKQEDDQCFPILHFIIDDLLADGADIYLQHSEKKFIEFPNPQLSMLTTLSSVEIVGRYLPPSFAKLLLKHFPDSTDALIVHASQNCNLELVEYLLSWSGEEGIFKFNKISEALNYVGVCIDETMKSCHLSYLIRDPVKMKAIRLRKTLIEKVRDRIKTFNDSGYDLARLNIKPITFNANIELIKAVKCNNISKIHYLIKNKLINNINLHDKDRISALMYSIGDNNIQVSKILLEAGADPLIVSSEELLTPLHQALYKNNRDFLESIFCEDILFQLREKLTNVDIKELLSLTLYMNCLNSHQWLSDNFLTVVATDQQTSMLESSESLTLRKK